MVSRSRNGAFGVHEATRKKVLAQALLLNYHPNLLATGLATGRTHKLAMVISDIRSPFLAELVGATHPDGDSGEVPALSGGVMERLKSTTRMERTG